MRSVLLIRLGAMGDVIHALPAAASVRAALGAGSSLTWLIEPRWAPLLADNPYVDHVLTFDRTGWSALFQSIRDLRQQRFDMVVDLQGLMKSALLASLARSNQIFGLHRSLVREKAAARMYSKQVRSNAEHVIDRYMDVAVAAAGGPAIRAFPLPEGRPEGELPAGPFVLGCPAAGWKAKEWPSDYWKELAQSLRKSGITLVLNGRPQDAAELSRIEGAWVHLSSLGGLIDATRRAAAVVGVDSGPLHLAGALGKPGVAIFGPTDPTRNGPPGASITVLRSPNAVTSYRRQPHHDSSMMAIGAEMVFEALSARMAADVSRGAGHS
jgi:heptosyltransferase-1